MELRQIKYFVKAAESLNFSEAARALFVTQSTLSQQIRQLEEELHTQLFLRNSHNVSLTEAGEEFLPLALRTLQDAETCYCRMNDLQQLLTGTLNIGVTFSFSPILTETLLEFERLHPQVKLNVYYKPMEELMRMLEHRDLDFVLAFRPTARYDMIESHVLFDSTLAVIVGENHELGSYKSITLSELEKYDLVLPSIGLQARSAFDLLRARYVSNFKVFMELNEVNILLHLVKKSNLVTVLSEATIHEEEGVKAIPIECAGNQMEGCVHMLKNTYRKHSMQEFIRLLEESEAVCERRHDWI